MSDGSGRERGAIRCSGGGRPDAWSSRRPELGAWQRRPYSGRAERRRFIGSPTLNLTPRLAGARIRSMVFGSSAVRAAWSLTLNVAKPRMSIRSPRARASSMDSKIVLTAGGGSAPEPPHHPDADPSRMAALLLLEVAHGLRLRRRALPSWRLDDRRMGVGSGADPEHVHRDAGALGHGLDQFSPIHGITRGESISRPRHRATPRTAAQRSMASAGRRGRRWRAARRPPRRWHHRTTSRP